MTGHGNRLVGGIRVLYLVYWGAAEPLGQALVLPVVERLRAMGAQITLVTFDKAADIADQDGIAETRARLEGQGIQWISLRYHKSLQALAKLLDVATGIARSWWARGRADVVHARTFFGGLMGAIVAPLLRARLVYHAEGLYPEEMVDGGAWSVKSIRYGLTRWIEDAVYRRADGVIVLSGPAKCEIDTRLSSIGRATPVVVVPSVVDLERFRVLSTNRQASGTCLVYSGSIGYRYTFDRAARFVAIARQELNGLRLRVLTRADPGIVGRILRGSGLPDTSWSVEEMAYAGMPAALSEADAGLCFGTQGGSERGGSPTKIGEYWACGLPVVVTPNVGDVDAIVQDEGVGVIVEAASDEAYRSAARRLAKLLRDPTLRVRCRQAAEKHFALEPACRAQLGLYCRVLGLENAVP